MCVPLRVYAIRRLEEITPPSTIGISRTHQWLFAAGFIGAWGPLSVWNAYRTTLFVIWYQADVAAMGVVQTVAAIVDAVNGPCIAHIADAATINRHMSRFPLHKWGRRAPLLVMGAPIMMAGPVLMWLVPSRERTVTTAWYGICFFLFVWGNSITLQSCG